MGTADFTSIVENSTGVISTVLFLVNVENESDVVNTEIEFDALLSDYVVEIFQWVAFTVICQVIDIFGIGANSINIICFVQQGFKDSFNVSLLGLAVSDLGCLIPLVLTNICFAPAFISADLPFSPLDIQYLVSGTCHVTFTHVTAWITALITLERCLCITAPLQVKNIITPKRTFIIILCVFIILISSVAPIYVVNGLGMRWSPERNHTVLGLVFKKDREQVEKISFAINNTFVPISAFLIVIICTVILVMHLKRSRTWLENSKAVLSSEKISKRNQKVAKTVVMISVLFISCFVPASIAFLVMAFEPKLSFDGKYRNILTVIGGLAFLLESVNSSVNIFIYYHMSSKFRSVLRNNFGLKDM